MALGVDGLRTVPPELEVENLSLGIISFTSYYPDGPAHEKDLVEPFQGS